LRKLKKAIKRIVGSGFYNWCRNHFLHLKAKSKLNKRFKEEIKSLTARINFYSSFINPNDLCFDVGANIGNRITPLLELGANVVAIEPQTICIDFLKKTFGDKIKIVEKGLGAKEEIKRFYISNATTISTFSQDWISDMKKGRFKNYEWNKVKSIQITTLDKLIAEFGKPKFIKIDVEGYEEEVLKGLSSRVEILSYEYAVPEQTNKALKCLEIIEKINPEAVCNFSVGESMEFYFKQWNSIKKMKNFIRTQEFINTEFGDIYVK
jgi:FkbM family methyltransferase